MLLVLKWLGYPLVLQANHSAELWFLVLIKKSLQADLNSILELYCLCHVQQLTKKEKVQSFSKANEHSQAWNFKKERSKGD